MYCVTTKSSMLRANTVSRLAAIAGASSGSSTRRIRSHGGAPRSAAASSTSLPIITSRPRTISTTQESENVTWPITCAGVPSPMKPNADVNSRNRPTANTSSGVTSGSSIRMFETPAPRPRQRCRPIASATPSGVAISIASPASSSECSSAAASVGSLRTLSVGSVQNQRSEKPCADVRERPSLNANRIANTTGSSDQTT